MNACRDAGPVHRCGNVGGFVALAIHVHRGNPAVLHQTSAQGASVPETGRTRAFPQATDGVMESVVNGLTPRQQELIEAALRVLDREGIDGCSMRVLANEVGLSPMAAYKHFENQRELHLHLWQACMRTYDRYVLDYVLPEGELPIDTFLGFCRRYIEFGTRHPHRFELIFTHPFVREVRKEEWLTEDRFRMYRTALHYVEAARAAGHLRPDLALDEVMVFATSYLVGVTQTLNSDRNEALTPLSEQHLIESSLRMLRAGIVHPSLTG